VVAVVKQGDCCAAHTDGRRPGTAIPRVTGCMQAKQQLRSAKETSTHVQ
jgi:hypothetical protein